MKKEDIKELTSEELQLRLQEEKANYVKYRMNHAVSPVDNPMKMRDMRRGIARIHTELTKRAKAEQSK
ncbi:MAG: 50S ribosomal protein L29 [Bacteroidota bacterium]|jgi:large subunit ribosomal protein L29|uniref:50S ribosomal protein L29 n=1 Tax=Candidatus Pollutiaquabacter sp. TaxID=3416354 RepID=UPI001B546AB9|nr:50S ribosomal protein L29 [Bacteroidota bacterium]MBP6009491.1 50S ribosomal protein L29 [Bacteroidia bacterium]MBP7268744.1 50S ribosomal protein L29 [Bacteroidia bacterium]MBP7437272.1 50S ribosomal protein L29 [Bacteroidia bacterium]MBP7771576.1 50S ribosomal protein L29 [Bacteroidia bacterium]